MLTCQKKITLVFFYIFFHSAYDTVYECVDGIANNDDGYCPMLMDSVVLGIGDYNIFKAKCGQSELTPAGEWRPVEPM